MLCFFIRLLAEAALSDVHMNVDSELDFALDRITNSDIDVKKVAFWIDPIGLCLLCCNQLYFIIYFDQVCTFHDGCKQGINKQIFNRKSISRKIMHPQSLFK